MLRWFLVYVNGMRSFGTNADALDSLQLVALANSTLEIHCRECTRPHFNGGIFDNRYPDRVSMYQFHFGLRHIKKRTEPFMVCPISPSRANENQLHHAVLEQQNQRQESRG